MYDHKVRASVRENGQPATRTSLTAQSRDPLPVLDPNHANSLPDHRQNVPALNLGSNRPTQLRQLKDSRSSAIPVNDSENNLKKSANAATIQLYSVPDDLEKIRTITNETITDISNIGPSDKKLDGSDEWAGGTYLATARKLNEWKALKVLIGDVGGNHDGLNPGFGKNDFFEPDAAITNASQEYAYAAENKFVNGGQDQVIVNIKNALSQLCKGFRSHKYNGTKLLARVEVMAGSGAYEWLETPGVAAGRVNFWQKTVDDYARDNFLAGKCNLSLLVCSGDKEYLKYNIDTEKSKNLFSFN